MEKRKKANDYLFTFLIFRVMRITARLSFLCAWVVSRAILNFVNVYGILFELLENDSNGIRKPFRLSFKSNAFLEFLVVLDSIRYLISRFCPFDIYGVVELSRSFIAKSHRTRKYREIR